METKFVSSIKKFGDITINFSKSLIVDIETTYLQSHEKEILNHPIVGGVILFTRNFESRKQLKALCTEIRTCVPTPIIIMVDQEGGRVQRFRQGFTRLPNLRSIGKLYDRNPNQALYLSQECGWLMATELLSVGIDMSLAPVLDIDNKISEVIGERAFHRDGKIVTALANAYVAGMQEAGMISTGKHFPGHGSIPTDTHTHQAQDSRTLEEVMQSDLVPFQNLITNKISAIMSSHIVFANVDSNPVTYSSYWLRTVLRKQLKFSGIIISDDLNMQAASLSHSYLENFLQAKLAGCDLALLCNNPKGVLEIVNNINVQPENINSVLGENTVKSLQGKTNNQSYRSPRWHAIHAALMKENKDDLS